MTSISARLFSRNLLRDRNVLGSFCSRLPVCNAHTATAVQTVEKEKPAQKTITYKSLDYFQVGELFTVKDLFDARVHYGHTESNLHDSMKQFIFGSRLGHLIFDLDQTAELLQQALNFVAYVAYNGGIILFVGRNPHYSYVIERTALNCKEYCHTRHWKQGLFTNYVSLYKLEARLPDVCIFLNTMDGTVKQHHGILEATKMCIPTVAVVDSNCDRRLVTYPIPGSDDSLPSLTLYCKLFEKVILRAKEVRKQHDQQNFKL